MTDTGIRPGVDSPGQFFIGGDMNHRERAFWQWLDGKVGNLWHAQRHEDKHSVGIPDVSYGCRGTQGWIELKSLTTWPRKGFPALSVEQANWLIGRGNSGAMCLVVVEVIGDIFVIPWIEVPLLFKQKGGKEEIKKLASGVYNKKEFCTGHFLEIITKGKYR